MGYWSPEARKAYRSKNAALLREKTRDYTRLYPERRKQTVKKTQAKIDDIVYSAKNKPCLDCGNCFPLCAMQFDHARGTKVADIAKLRSSKGKNKILIEIDKCDVVCANCHAIRTCLRDTRPKARRCSHE